MSHVFISYVHENLQIVQRLRDELARQGVKVWLDRDDIEPGTRWKQAIRRAISKGSFFIACFSREYTERAKTYVNEELTLAIDELRQRPADRAWFIPVKLSECQIPDRDIGGGETLRDIQYLELHRNWETGIQRLLSVVLQSPIADDPNAELPPDTDVAPSTSMGKESPRWKSIIMLILIIVGFVALMVALSSFFDRTLIVSIIGLVTIIGTFGGLFEHAYHRFFDDLKIVIRKDTFLQHGDFDLLKTSFSIANVTGQRAYINSVNLRVGDYTRGGPPPTKMIIVRKFPHKLRIALTRDTHSETVKPILTHTPSDQSMGTQVFSLLGGKRLGLEPKEQIDFELDIQLERPVDLAGKYKEIWNLGGQVLVEYEFTDLKKKYIRYPRQLK